MCRGKSLAMEAGGEGAGAGHRFIGREASDAVGQPLGRPAVTPTRCPVASALLASRGTGAARLFQETREVSQRQKWWHRQVFHEFRELLPSLIRADSCAANSPSDTSFTKWTCNSPEKENHLHREKSTEKEALHHLNLNWKVSSCHPHPSCCHLVSHP